MLDCVSSKIRPNKSQCKSSPSNFQGNTFKPETSISADNTPQVTFTGILDSLICKKVDKKILKDFNYVLANDKRLSYPITYKKCSGDDFGTVKCQKNNDTMDFKFWFLLTPSIDELPQLKASVDLKTGKITAQTVNSSTQFKSEEVKKQLESELLMLTRAFRGAKVYLKQMSIAIPDGVEVNGRDLHIEDWDKVRY